MFAHVDADSFFASVLERKDPRLKGKPILALGAGGGVVIAASYAAKAKGVKTGMRRNDAMKLCPDAVALLSDFTEACTASEQIEMILLSLTPAVEQMSVDEWFLDLTKLVGGVPQDPARWAHELQQSITRSVGIGMSVGIAPTKLLAKMASEYRKPAGVTIIQNPIAGVHEPQLQNKSVALELFLRDRPAAAIPGIGHARQVHAASLNWQTAWDFACAETKTVVHLFGRPGNDLQEELKGHPRSSVVTETRLPKSISRGRSFRATNDRQNVFGTMVQHLSICVLRMRHRNLACHGIVVWMRDGSFRFASDHLRLPHPLDTEERLLPYLKVCFGRVWGTISGCTQAGLALTELKSAGSAQYSLFEAPQKVDRAEQAQQAIDEVRKRFGRESVVRATGLDPSSSKRARMPNAYGRIGEVD